MSSHPPALTPLLHYGISYNATLENFGEEFVMCMQYNEVEATSAAGIFPHAMEFNSEIRAEMHYLREKERRSEGERVC